MKTLYLHVGHSKTGSSYIQSSLAASYNLLKDQGILYPKTPDCSQTAVGHISSGNGNLLLEKELATLSDYPSSYHSILFSSEWLFDRIFDRLLEKNIRTLINTYEFKEIQFLLFIRNPIEHASSAYQQLIKRSGGIFDIDRLFEKYNYPLNVDRFLKHEFGFNVPVKTTVINYSYARNCVLDSVTNWLGLAKIDLNAPQVEQVNRSLSIAELEFQRNLNKYLGPSGDLLSDQLCLHLPETQAEHIYPSENLQRRTYQRLSTHIDSVNNLIPHQENYRFEIKKSYVNPHTMKITSDQINVIVRSLATEILNLRSSNSQGSLDLPPEEIRVRGEDDAKFIRIAKQNFHLLREYGAHKTSKILDIGSGSGRLAYELNAVYPNFGGEYIGVDIRHKHIKWCQKNIELKLANVKFKHIELQNEIYNVHTSERAVKYPFDLESRYFDMVSIFSVFTHMYEENVVTYLNETKRMLKEGGVCIATFFLYDEDHINQTNSIYNQLPKHEDLDTQLSFLHQINSHTRYFNSKDPLHAIAYEFNYIMELIDDLGFSLLKSYKGKWAGGKSNQFQDVLILQN